MCVNIWTWVYGAYVSMRFISIRILTWCRCTHVEVKSSQCWHFTLDIRRVDLSNGEFISSLRSLPRQSECYDDFSSNTPSDCIKSPVASMQIWSMFFDSSILFAYRAINELIQSAKCSNTARPSSDIHIIWKNFVQIIRRNKRQMRMISTDSKIFCYLQPDEVGMFIVLIALMWM